MQSGHFGSLDGAVCVSDEVFPVPVPLQALLAQLGGNNGSLWSSDLTIALSMPTVRSLRGLRSTVAAAFNATPRRCANGRAVRRLCPRSSSLCPFPVPTVLAREKLALIRPPSGRLPLATLVSGRHRVRPPLQLPGCIRGLAREFCPAAGRVQFLLLSARPSLRIGYAAICRAEQPAGGDVELISVGSAVYCASWNQGGWRLQAWRP